MNTFQDKSKLKATSNQIKIGTPVTTISAPTPAANRVITIPDVSGDSHVVTSVNPLWCTNAPSAGQKMVKTGTYTAEWQTLVENTGNGQLGSSISTAYWQQGGSGKVLRQLPLLLNGQFAGRYFLLH